MRLAVLQLLLASSCAGRNTLVEEHNARPKRVAIIGAGAGGSSAAYHLSQYASQAGIPLAITVYERNSYVGGRSTTVAPFNDTSLHPVELGASIFVDVNRILKDSAAAFNLTAEAPYIFASDKPTFGIYNGKGLLFSVASGWMDKAKLLWRYGYAPVKADNLMKATVGKFLKIYEEGEGGFPFPSLTKRVYDLGLKEACGTTGEQFLKANGIGEKYANEVIQAMTRVNYAQNLPLIHGLETMCSMATNGAMAIKGGNWRIFEAMLNASSSEKHLSTNVTSIVKHSNGTFTIKYKSDTTTESSSSDFDTVILAAPYQFADLDVSPKLQKIPDKIPYVDLYVTLFTSPHYLDPEPFGLENTQVVPQMLLTTLQEDERPGANASYEARAGFHSISCMGSRYNRKTGGDQYLYKIFSQHEISDGFLAKILGLPHPRYDDEQSEDRHWQISKDDVSWIYRKLWQSYPYEFPRVTFEELRLDDNFWYTSGIESFISTMETSALMGKNVARLVVDEWLSRAGSPLRTAKGPGDLHNEQEVLNVEL